MNADETYSGLQQARLNKEILEKANDAVKKGDHETFLSYCTDDTVWNFIGDKILKGKEAVRQYMAETYVEPPRFQIDTLISEEDFVTAVGKISLKENGNWVDYDYCDVWRIKNGLLWELRGFVVKI